MQIRQSALNQFGDFMVRAMRTAGESDPDVKCSLEYMHSTYRNKKVLTLVSPETGGMVLFTQDAPCTPFGLIITSNTVLPGDTKCWTTYLQEEDLGIRGKQTLAQWLVDVFKQLSYLDTDVQFIEKMNALQKEDAVDLQLKSITGGTLDTFYHKQFDI